MIYHRIILTLFSLIFLLFSGFSIATEKSSNPNASFATVNGVSLKNTLLDQVIKNNNLTHSTISPETLDMLKKELVAREVLSQYSFNHKLNERFASYPEIILLKQNYFIEAAKIFNRQQHPITEQDLTNLYEKRNQSFKDANQYKIKTLIFDNEKNAALAITKLKNKSLKKDFLTKKSGYIGSWPENDNEWFLANQLNKPIADVITTLVKNDVANKPIKINEVYHVIQIIDVRKFKAPPFDDVKQVLHAELVAAQQKQFVDDLISKATVKYN